MLLLWTLPVLKTDFSAMGSFDWFVFALLVVLIALALVRYWPRIP